MMKKRLPSLPADTPLANVTELVQLQQGLDEYVIEGVQHNARLINAVLRHPSFQAGETPTSFLPNHLPNFQGVQLSDSQQEELAVAVALIGLTRESFLQRPTVVPAFEPVIVRLGGMFGMTYHVKLGDDKKAVVRKLATDNDDVDGEEKVIEIGTLKYSPESYIAHVSLNGSERAIQVRMVS